MIQFKDKCINLNVIIRVNENSIVLKSSSLAQTFLVVLLSASCILTSVYKVLTDMNIIWFYGLGLKVEKIHEN